MDWAGGYRRCSHRKSVCLDRNGGFNLRYNENQELFEYVCQQANQAPELMVGEKTKVSRSSSIVP